MLNKYNHSKLVEVLKKAGNAIILCKKNGLEIGLKSNGTKLTNADLVSNEIIVEYLLSEYPSFGVISEESADLESISLDTEYIWLLDPLDGTSSFINGKNDYTINIALLHNKDVIYSVIYAPELNELYYAEKGKGSYKLNTITNEENSIKISKLEKNITALVGYDTHNAKLIHNSEINLKKATGAYKFCLLASGEAHLYYRAKNISEWDTASGYLLINEAGGIVKTKKWEDIKYLSDNNFNHINGLVAVNIKSNFINKLIKILTK